MTGARQHAEQRLKGGTVSLRLVSRRLTMAALSLLLALLVAAPAAHAAPPQVVHEQTIHLETETLETVCGDTAVFDWSGTDTFTLVDMTDGLYFWVLVSRATYTLTFQDPSLGVQEGRLIQTESVRATPGGAFTFSFVINERSGDVRIHGTMTFVVSADGTIRVQNETFDFSGCPSA
jgi:opacity protein-like surface antigen